MIPMGVIQHLPTGGTWPPPLELWEEADSGASFAEAMPSGSWITHSYQYFAHSSDYLETVTQNVGLTESYAVSNGEDVVVVYSTSGFTANVTISLDGGATFGPLYSTWTGPNGYGCRLVLRPVGDGRFYVQWSDPGTSAGSTRYNGYLTITSTDPDDWSIPVIDSGTINDTNIGTDFALTCDDTGTTIMRLRYMHTSGTGQVIDVSTNGGISFATIPALDAAIGSTRVLGAPIYGGGTWIIPMDLGYVRSTDLVTFTVLRSTKGFVPRYWPTVATDGSGNWGFLQTLSSSILVNIEDGLSIGGAWWTAHPGTAVGVGTSATPNTIACDKEGMWAVGYTESGGKIAKLIDRLTLIPD